MPTPIARCDTLCPCPRLSNKMPATLPPFSKTSLGHFNANGSVRPVTATNASNNASDVTKLRSATISGLSTGRISKVAAKLPSGIDQGRPRLPRAALCDCASIQVGAVISFARRAASAFVLSVCFRTIRPKPSGQSIDKSRCRRCCRSFDTKQVHDAQHHDRSRSHQEHPLRRVGGFIQCFAFFAEIHVKHDA